MIHLRVRVPASTSNLGPGFDALGLALALYNELRVESSPPRALRNTAAARRALKALQPDIAVRGEGADSLPTGKSNLVFRAMRDVMLATRRVPESLSLSLLNRIPLARGLGSSATAALAGVLAANEICDARLTRDDILGLAAGFDGHPDNAAASLLGGLTVSLATEAGPRAVQLPIRDRYRCVVVVPSYELATQRARRAIPKALPRTDAVFSLARAAALAGLLVAGDDTWLAEATRDRIHQPRRAPLLPGFERAVEVALKAGALASFLSGAGPTVAALVPKRDTESADKVQRAMKRVYTRLDISARTLSLSIDRQGAHMTKMAR